MKRAIFVTLLALLATRSWAADSAKRYLALKDDSGLYVGEGVAELKEFDGDGLKALAAAKERAQAALASAIRVRIQSQTKEVSSSVSGETFSAETQSLADVVLENVKSEDFENFPDKGKITALDYVSKEDYRRQLAGKATPLYRPENGLRVNFGGYYPFFLGGYVTKRPTNGNIVGTTTVGGGFDPALDLGVDAVWRNFVLGLAFANLDEGVYTYNITSSPSPTNAPGWNTTDLNVTLLQAQAGYEWTPFSSRLQPFFPFRIEDAFASLSSVKGNLMGLSGGLGLRYWPNDSLALQVVGVYHQGLNSFRMNSYGGTSYIDSDPSHSVTVSLTGMELRAGILWSGF
jgi:hypothetical protein